MENFAKERGEMKKLQSRVNNELHDKEDGKVAERDQESKKRKRCELLTDK